MASVQKADPNQPNYEARLNAYNAAVEYINDYYEQLEQRKIDLEQEAAQLQLHASSTTTAVPRPPPAKRRTQTCYDWSGDRCTTQSECKNTMAHNFFPTIVWRAHSNGVQLEPCRNGWHGNPARGVPPCCWHDAVCGYAHEPEESEFMQRLKDLKNFTARLPYRPLCVLQCKQCQKTFPQIEDVRRHCESGECGGEPSDFKGVARHT